MNDLPVLVANCARQELPIVPAGSQTAQAALTAVAGPLRESSEHRILDDEPRSGPMNPLEMAGFVTGALSVWLAVRQNPWNWPFGVANAVCFLVLFWQARLYGDMALQVLFMRSASLAGIAGCLVGPGIHDCT